MGARQRLVDEAARRAKRQMDEAIHELVKARTAAGLSHQFVADAVGCSRQEIGAIEARRVVAPSLSLLARYGAVVGLDVSHEPTRRGHRSVTLGSSRSWTGFGARSRGESGRGLRKCR